MNSILFSYTYYIRCEVANLPLIQRFQRWWKLLWGKQVLFLYWKDFIEFKKITLKRALLMYEGLQNRNAGRKVVSSNKKILPQSSTRPEKSGIGLIGDTHWHINARFVFQTKDMWLQIIVAWCFFFYFLCWASERLKWIELEDKRENFQDSGPQISACIRILWKS